MQQSIVKFIALSYRHCSTCFGHHNAHHQEPVKPQAATAVVELLMMGMRMPETCWLIHLKICNKVNFDKKGVNVFTSLIFQN